MAASFYIYEDLKNYKLLYPRKQTVESEIPIMSWHILPKKGVWVVVDLENRLGRSSMEGSLKIILDGEIGLKKHRTHDLIDIDKSNIKYFYKNDVITFHSDDATYEYKCSRYIGEPISKGKFRDFFIPSIDIGSDTFYDPGRNRINLILKDPEISVAEIESVSSPSHSVSS